MPEQVSAIIFIGAVIIGVTQLLKLLNAKDYQGAAVIAAAAVVGALVGIVDVNIGLADITVAQGLLAGFGAVGVHTTAKQIG